MKTKLVSYLGTRVARDHRKAFIARARKEFGVGCSEALRELIVAFVENRITVAPTQPKEFLK